MSFCPSSLVKEAPNLSEIRCFSHDFWSINEQHSCQNVLFPQNTMCQLAFWVKFGPELEVSSANNQTDIVDREE